MSKAIRPVVRSLIACEQIRREPGNRLTVVRIIHATRARSGHAFPLIRPEFAVLAVVTNGRGSGDVWIEFRHADTDRVSYRSRRQTARFPADPLQVCALTFEIRNLIVPAPGLYWVQLWFDDEMLADLPIQVR